MHPNLKKMKKSILIISILILSIGKTFAEKDTKTLSTASNTTASDSTCILQTAKQDTLPELSKREQRRLRVAKRNFHYNILGGPGYTPDFGLVVGGSSLMTFRINPNDSTQKRSIIPLTFAFVINGGMNVMVKPQLFFKDDKFRIFGTFLFKNTLENYYGVGYGTNKNYPRGEETSEYRYKGMQINPWFLFKLGKSNFFAGAQIDVNYDEVFNPANKIIEDTHYKNAGGTVDGYKNFSSGIGFLLTYDTRDIPVNAYKGIYLDLRGMMYHKIFGSDDNFYRFEMDYRQYKSLGKRKVFAWNIQTKNVFGSNIPLLKYSLSGSPFDLRGYYLGQYRDKSSHLVMAEYRQMINTDKSTWIKKALNHIGFVGWTGCGFIGPNPGRIEGVLPNVGVGLRVEIQPRMNIRLDLGRNMKNKETLFYFNMTEAF